MADVIVPATLSEFREIPVSISWHWAGDLDEGITTYRLRFKKEPTEVWQIGKVFCFAVVDKLFPYARAREW